MNVVSRGGGGGGRRRRATGQQQGRGVLQARSGKIPGGSACGYSKPHEDGTLYPRIRPVLVCADVVVRGLRGVLVLFGGLISERPKSTLEKTARTHS